MPPKRPELPPEPWSWNPRHGIVYDHNGKAIARLTNFFSIQDIPRPECGPILAAAPAALRVCEDVVRFDNEMNDSEEAYLAHVAAARAVLAIAYPEPPEEKPLEKRLADHLKKWANGDTPHGEAWNLIAECRQRGWLEE